MRQWQLFLKASRCFNEAFNFVRDSYVQQITPAVCNSRTTVCALGNMFKLNSSPYDCTTHQCQPWVWTSSFFFFTLLCLPFCQPRIIKHRFLLTNIRVHNPPSSSRHSGRGSASILVGCSGPYGRLPRVQPLDLFHVFAAGGPVREQGQRLLKHMLRIAHLFLLGSLKAVAFVLSSSEIYDISFFYVFDSISSVFISRCRGGIFWKTVVPNRGVAFY